MMANRNWRRYDTSTATYYRWRTRAVAAGMAPEYFQYLVSLHGIKYTRSMVLRWEGHGGDPNPKSAL